jgi:hypothetical protein
MFEYCLSAPSQIFKPPAAVAIFERAPVQNHEQSGSKRRFRSMQLLSALLWENQQQSNGSRPGTTLSVDLSIPTKVSTLLHNFSSDCTKS